MECSGEQGTGELAKQQPIPMWNLRKSIDHLCAIDESIKGMKLFFLKKQYDIEQKKICQEDY